MPQQSFARHIRQDGGWIERIERTDEDTRYFVQYRPDREVIEFKRWWMLERVEVASLCCLD